MGEQNWINIKCKISIPLIGGYQLGPAGGLGGGLWVIGCGDNGYKPLQLINGLKKKVMSSLDVLMRY